VSRAYALVAAVVLVPGWAGFANAMGGSDMTWSDSCWIDAPHAVAAFDCRTNTGVTEIMVSFQLADDQPAFVGVAIVIDLEVGSPDVVLPSLPDWWQFFNAGSCRRTALTTTTDFQADPVTRCEDPWNGLAQGGIGAYQTIGTSPPVPRNCPSCARLKVFYALSNPVPLVAGPMYRACRITIGHTASVGPGACAGCTLGATFALEYVQAAEATGASQFLSDPTSGGNQCLMWNNSGVPCSAVPVRNVTWGRLKAIWR
jgi:hypothetical protein